MNNKTILFLSLIILATSCKVMYVPNMVNVPLFKEKNEFRGTVSLSDYQFAYAPIKNIGLMANGYVRNSSFTNLANYSTSRNLFEGGVGYFKPLNEGFVFETYAVGGVGNLNYNNSDTYNSNTTNNKYSAGFTRFFIQPSIGYTNDFVDIAFSTRIVQLGFNSVKYDGYTAQDLEKEEILNLDKTKYYFIEPTFTIRLGYKWCKIHLQAIYSNKVNIEPLNYQKFTMNFGLHINIAPRLNKSKNMIEELSK